MVDTAVSGAIDAKAVFRRTSAGQREAVFAETLTSSSARRLLLVVNGVTPLGNLLEMDRGLADAMQLTGLLVESGLLERVEH